MRVVFVVLVYQDLLEAHATLQSDLESSQMTEAIIDTTVHNYETKIIGIIEADVEEVRKVTL